MNFEKQNEQGFFKITLKNKNKKTLNLSIKDYTTKDTIKRVKRQATEWRGPLQKRIRDTKKDLYSKYIKNFYQSITKLHTA